MPYVLKSLQITNCKNIRSLSLELNGEGTTITGRNGHGKSAFMDAIKWCVTGNCMGEIVTEGEDSCTVRLVLKGEKIELTVKAVKGKTGQRRVEIFTEDSRVKSPQKFLDMLADGLTFNPLRFDLLGEDATGRRRQREILMGVAGLDFAALDAEHDKVYEERRTVNKETKHHQAQVDACEFPDDTPDEYLESDDIASAMKAELEKSKAKAKATQTIEKERSAIENQIGHLMREDVEIKKLADALLVAQGSRLRLKQNISEREVELTEAEKLVKNMPEADVDSLRDKMSDVDDINGHVRTKKIHAAFLKESKNSQKTANAFSTRLVTIDEEKAKMLSDASWPVEGLGVTDDGVTFNDRAYESWNHAERAKIATAIAIHQNSNLKLILIDNSESIGPEVQDAINEMAEANGVQVIYGRYQEEAGPVGVHIHEGKIE